MQLLLKLVVLLLVATSLTFGQSARHRHPHKARLTHPYSSSKTTSSEIVQLTEKLRAHGATVSITKEKIYQPFFSVAGRIIKLSGEALQVFEYAKASPANSDASRVSADGTTIGTRQANLDGNSSFF
jgi:hypothetical protein